jgi:co-chaperonin GroES (HSP10)
MVTLDQIQLFGDRLLVRPDAKYETSEGGLHIPQTVLADNPNYYTMTGTLLRLGDGYREDVYECLNQQCRYQSRRTVGEWCPVCRATQQLAYADSGVHAFEVRVGDRVLFGRFAGRPIRVCEGVDGPRSSGPSGAQTTLLIMREVEVLGIVDDAARVLPGYQAAEFGRASAGVTV